ncbi:MAG TPA: hypothetical protein VEK08_13970 [Planctomycetota bacterium]|nr:hypothetical protein [Planctomycetota bacterium]
MRPLSTFVVLTMLTAMNAFAATLDEIEADVSSKWESLQSMSYNIEAKNDSVGEGFEFHSTSTGTYEMARKDANFWNMRMETVQTGVNKIQGNETKVNSTSLMIVNGDIAYSLTETNGLKSAMKTKAAAWSQMVGKGFFKWLKEENTAKVLPDETVDGQSCYVIEAVLKGNPTLPTRYYFSKSNGITIQTSSKSTDGKTTSVTTLKNIKLNPSIAADRFVFTAPAGVTVQDMTDMEAYARKAQADAEAASKKAQEDAAKNQTAEKKEEKKEEPRKEEAKKEESKKEESKPEKTKNKIKKGFGL